MVANAPRQEAALPPQERERLRVRVHHLVAIAVWAIVIGLVLYFFAPMQMVALGFLAAAAVTALLRPIVRALPGKRSRRATLVGIAFIVTSIGLVYLASRLIAEPIREQLSHWPQIRQDLNSALGRLSTQLGLDEPLNVESLLTQAMTFLGGGGPQVVSATTNIVAEVLLAVAFVFIGSFYLLVTPPGRLSDPLIAMLPGRRQPSARAMLTDLEPKLRWWLIGTMVSMMAVGVLSWLGYMAIGLRFAATIAILMALAEIVPNIGPAVGFLIALAVALAQGTTQVVGVVGVWCVIQVAESYVLQPLIMKRAVKVPPVVTLFTLVLWGKMLGVGGLLLAIPLDLVIWSAAVHFVQRRDEGDDDVSEATDRPGRIETSRREGEPSRELVRE